MKRVLPVYAAAAYTFLHAPLWVLAAFSFNSSRFTRWEGFSLRWYAEMAADAGLIEAAVNSLVIAAITAVAAAAVGTLAAHGLWKRRDRWLESGLALTLVTPEIVMGVSLLAFFQFLFRYTGLRLGMHTVILAHVMFSVAFVATVVSARLRTMDRTLEEAALDLGATEWQAFRMVTLPQLRPAVLAGGLLAFAISFDDFVVTSLVAGVDSTTLPMVIYAMARRGISPVVNAISTVILLGIGALILAAGRGTRE